MSLHISVAFTWDLLEAERLAYVWYRYDNIKTGISLRKCVVRLFYGLYLKHCYTTTSHGFIITAESAPSLDVREF